MRKKTFGIGLDFGTDSVRSLLVDYDTGRAAGRGISYYRRWKTGAFCRPSLYRYRHHPLDYLESLDEAISKMLSSTSADTRKQIGSIAAAATGSTVCPTDRSGTPLSLLPGYEKDEDALFHLWKDHTAKTEAEEFNRLSASWETDFCQFQGSYSSEWFWAKIAHTVRTNPSIRDAAWSWIELCDWIPAILTGNTSPQSLYRSSCAAGHKALWNSSFSGLPDRDFLATFEPYAALMYDRYLPAPRPADSSAGLLSSSFAERWGLSQDVVVGGSSLDAHAGAVGIGIEEDMLVSILGTSAVHLCIEPYGSIVPSGRRRFCGMAEDSIIPGWWGIESGQSAFGDVLSWFARTVSWSQVHSAASGQTESLTGWDDKNVPSILQRLDHAMARMPEAETPICIDWFNGRRYPDGCDSVKGALLGLNLGTDVPALYSSLVEGILFGMRRIIGGITEKRVRPLTHIRTAGGIVRKSPTLMQRMASIIGLPILAVDQDESCALGAAMYGAVASGRFSDIPAAQQSMAARTGTSYIPDPIWKSREDQRFEKYLEAANLIDSHYRTDRHLR